MQGGCINSTEGTYMCKKVALSGARGYKLIRVAVIYREGQLATEKSKE